jgi:hypothetical protein
MQYNRRTDYRVSREVAQVWWKSLPDGKFVVCDASRGVPGVLKDNSSGPWVVANPNHTEEFAGVVTQPLTDGSGQWGLAVLWYDRTKCSRLSRMLRSRKLSGSQEAAALVGKTLLRQGGEEMK